MVIHCNALVAADLLGFDSDLIGAALLRESHVSLLADTFGNKQKEAKSQKSEAATATATTTLATTASRATVLACS